jgi:hypothetical protein
MTPAAAMLFQTPAFRGYGFADRRAARDPQ